MKYSASYMFSKDIDWFFKMNSQYYHVASAGGILPSIINDREKIRQIQYQVFNLPYIFPENDIRINEDFIRNLLSRQLNDDPDLYGSYIRSFVDFARKGFISCDRTEVSDCMDNRYHIVCTPPSFDHDLNIDGLPVFKDPGFKFRLNSSDVKLLDIIK